MIDLPKIIIGDFSPVARPETSKADAARSPWTEKDVRHAIQVLHEAGLKIHDDLAKQLSLEAKAFSDSRTVDDEGYITDDLKPPYAYTLLYSKMGRIRHAIKTLPMFAGEIPEVNYRAKPKDWSCYNDNQDHNQRSTRCHCRGA
jgi:hypothetical protein